MKKLAFASVALATFSVINVASAADMAARPLKAPPLAAPPAATWTGFYAGLNAGYGFGSDPTTETTVSAPGFGGGFVLTPGTSLYGAPRNFKLAPDGFAGGGQVGYNYQFSPMGLLGIEADIQGTTMKDTKSCIITCGAQVVTVPGFLSLFPVVFSDISAQHKLNWFGTLRGRLGYTAGPVLIYGTGGLAYGEVERSGNVVGTTVGAISGLTYNTFAGSYDNKTVKVGWTVGAGVEGKINQKWSVKAEYLYVDLGSTSDTFTTLYTTAPRSGVVGGTAATRTDSAKFHENVFRVGVNYAIGGM